MTGAGCLRYHLASISGRLGGEDIDKIEKPAGVRLASDFSFAETPGGDRVAFTRSERRALAVLAPHPDRLVTRDQILDALAGPGSDKSDRNIDFLINRLRRKLSDDARDPHYIATRYGEGYVWIGGPAGIDADYASAYLIVGPLRGARQSCRWPRSRRALCI